MSYVSNYARDGVVGIADNNNTYGHVELQKLSKKHGFKPLYGVRLHVIERNSKQRLCHEYTVFIARSQLGLTNLYKLVTTAWDQFYYFPRLYKDQLDKIEGVFIIRPEEVYHPDSYREGYIFIDDNYYPEPQDRGVYQLMAGSSKRGDGYSYRFNTKSGRQYITDNIPLPTDIYEATKGIADDCDHIEIPKAGMVKASDNNNILQMCIEGAERKGIDLDDSIYKARLERELELIKEKDYIDYFLIVSHIVKKAKEEMLVGPARGSSAGSLVCYLLDITEVDPIQHSLIFERFIDVNRFDLPDIDVDFPDRERHKVIDYIKHTYGNDHVSGLANINRFKPKLAIGEFAKGLGIPPWETDDVKQSIIERSSGDARAQMQILDTFNTTDAGKKFIEQYPNMRIVEKIENHASHAGKHAAGILVSTLPLTTYASVNNRDNIVMLDKKTAEELNLLKIDCLGLKTLSIIEDCCKSINMPPQAMYKIPLDDAATYELLNSHRLTGIFQFEGQALQMICKKIKVENFYDIAAITALARPGALNSGGTARYILTKNGEKTAIYHSDIHREITEETFGIVVYQEQMMEIARKIGGFSWEDTSTLRRAASKSLGDEFFGRYRERFIEGAKANGYEQPDIIWNDISSSGSWSFNKSHAVSYGLVSYWTAYLKANYPLHFSVAVLNHNENFESTVRYLRDIVVNEGIEYVPVDPDISNVGWSTDGEKIIGGLSNIIGIGPEKAKQVLNMRRGKGKLTPSLYKHLTNPKTPYDILFPAKHYWGEMYEKPEKYGIMRPMYIKDVDGAGNFIFIGRLLDRNPRNLNEQVFLERRGGERIETFQNYLNFTVEDDTDLISCTISRYDYDRLGHDITENGRVGIDWYLIKGSIENEKWRRIKCDEIVNLNKHFRTNV
jgi:DNA polymerase III alpha subunit